MSLGSTHCDVAIVGLGPVGGLLAGLLGKRGLRVIAIDRELDVFPLPRAAHIDHTGLRALQEDGCLDELLVDMVPNRGLEFTSADRTLLLRIPGDQLSVSGLPASMYFHQPGFDRCLRATAAAMDTVDVRKGVSATDLRSDEEGVTILTEDLDGSEQEIRASWAVGCDGATSTVRQAAGIGLDDLGFHERWLVVDLVLSHAAPELPSSAVNVCDPARPHVAIPMPGHRHRFEFMLVSGDDPDTIAGTGSVERLLTPWLPVGSTTIERSAIYQFHGLLAQHWRSGRIFLVGDAAHQMPPFLGQGMNSGFRDATNLAWKLDHVIRRRAPDRLLDTYESERAPHVRTIVEASIGYGRLICATDPAVAAERDRTFTADARNVAKRMPFALPRLEPGPLVAQGGGELSLQPPAPGGMRLDDRVGSRFLVLATEPEALTASADWWERELGALIVTPDELHEELVWSWLRDRGARVAVIRPDRYVLGSGEDLDDITDYVRGLLSPVSAGDRQEQLARD